MVITITGTFDAFQEAISHNRLDQQYPLFYQKRPTGFVDRVLIDGMEWIFPTNENKVTEALLRRAFKSAILVTAWIPR